jgi:hypothetical protein
MKFNLRDLFWLTAVVGLAAGWWVDHRWEEAKIRQEVEIREEIRANAMRNAFELAQVKNDLSDYVKAYGPLK